MSPRPAKPVAGKPKQKLPPLEREFSAGGLVVRRMRGKRYLAVVRVKGGTVLALPKGHIDPGETGPEAALREVREETGLEGRLIEKLGDVRYWYTRDGKRVLKVVSFFLLSYRAGSVRNYQREEVDGAEWLPLDEAPKRLAYKGEKQMAAAALSKLAQSS